MPRTADALSAHSPLLGQLLPQVDASRVGPAAGRPLSVDELRVLKARKDVFAPAGALSARAGAPAFEPRLSSGDNLRLEQRTRLGAGEMKDALERVLRASDGVSPGGEKERRMVQVLEGVRDVLAQIQARAAVRL